MDNLRLKRLRYRAAYRGSKELDMVFRAFLDNHLSGLSSKQLDELEVLMERNEVELAGWIFGVTPIPAEFDSPLMALLRQYKK